MSNHVLSHALHGLPVIKRLKGRKIILASNSPRRKAILETIGLAPDIVPSKFEEDLGTDSFPNLHEYPVATASHKAVEVYERLVTENPDDAPDLVIAADTVVLTHAQPSTSQTGYSVLPDITQELLEKPKDKEDNLRMLMDLNGSVCEVVTGVTVVYPVLQSPGYAIRSIDERSLVYFADNPTHLLKAYADCGEGESISELRRDLQGLGSLLVRKIEGDYNNVVGFPAASFFKLLDLILEEDEDFLSM
ncbi:septum formation protein maf [Moniliophthora roreri]|nr:septum formation protein maf [Moniliophthora roreri]